LKKIFDKEEIVKFQSALLKKRAKLKSFYKNPLELFRVKDHSKEFNIINYYEKNIKDYEIMGFSKTSQIKNSP